MEEGEDAVNMNDIKVGDKLQIHCYKHDGSLHRKWDEAIVLDIFDDYMVFGNNRTTVVDSDGKVWKTREPAVMFFYKDRWFNVIGQLKDYGIYFYCNIATPALIDNKVIKYIDYDLDLRVFPNGSFKILDRMEYKYHKKQMHYSSRLDFILKYELGNLIDMVTGKYYVLVEGDLSAVRAAVDAASKHATEHLIDTFVLGNPHESLFGAIYGTIEIENPKALGILETYSVASAIVAADTAAKTAIVDLIELRLARGMCGKSYLLLTGEVSAVSAAIDKAIAGAGGNGMFLDSSVIAGPDEKLWKNIL